MALPRRIRHSVSQQAQSLLVTGQRFDRFDQIRQRHFWSDYLFVPDSNGFVASGDYRLFTTPSGQSGQGFPFALTDRETNWKSANRVPDNQNFEVLELGVSILPGFNSDTQIPNANEPLITPLSANGANTFLQNTILAIQYLTNEISLGLCADFSQASSPTMGSFTGAHNALRATLPQEFVSNGFAAPGLRRRFNIPILLQHGETFSFNFKVPRTYWVEEGVAGPDVAFIARMDFWATESFVERS